MWPLAGEAATGTPGSRRLVSQRVVDGPALYLRMVRHAPNGHPPLPRRLAGAASGRSSVDVADEPWMHPEVIDAVARRVLELGASATTDQLASDTDLLTVADVARQLKVSPQWVYAHKRDLGAIRLGRGPKARLRFDLNAVLAAVTGHNSSPKSDPRRLQDVLVVASCQGRCHELREGLNVQEECRLDPLETTRLVLGRAKAARDVAGGEKGTWSGGSARKTSATGSSPTRSCRCLRPLN